ncbi:MAG: hypothetical protein ABW171_06385 [Steroidobacter sp.]
MDRRHLLQLILALGTTIVLSDTAASSACAKSLLGDLDAGLIEELGREYLAGRRDSAALDAVVKLLNADHALIELRKKVQADFTAGRLVNLSGWFVSETEGCVFAALSRCDV